MPPKGKGKPKPVEDEEEEDVEEVDITPTQGVAGGRGIPAGLLAGAAGNPELLAALQSRLDEMIGSSSGLIESLPKEIRRRVHALRNIQKDHLKLEVQFHMEVAALEKKYVDLFQPLYTKRSTIVHGDYEPTDVECTTDQEEPAVDDVPAEGEAPAAPAKGIPQFWLTVLQNNDLVSREIFEQDVEVLKFLEDVTVELLPQLNTGFILRFKFAPNPFFTNEVLTKTYHLNPEPEDGEMIYEGPILDKAEGTVINWLEGKDTTVKTVKKKQKKKGASGKTRTVIKQVKTDSFFNFFSPPQRHEHVEGDDEHEHDDEAEMEIEDKISIDFDIGETIKEKLVPEAVLWFTGEALDYEDGGDDDDYGDYMGGDGDEDDDDDDPSYHPPPAGVQPPPGECKQQ